jgi:Ser/Thr protein kinase RdoA (MazF antagonist)
MQRALSANPALARSILGTADPARVARRLDAFCEAHLGSGPDEVILCELSVGAAFGLRLAGGERVFLKAHPPYRPRDYLTAMHAVQAHLHERGFPCPGPLVGPSAFGAGLATVDEYLDTGEHPDGHDPASRRAMAGALARLIGLAREVRGVRGLEGGWNWPEKDRLWPRPHNALFDFEATARGAERIDRAAATARTVVDGFRGEVVVGHADWSADQVRLRDGEVSAVYDWDSLRLDKEVVFVGIAASNFTARWRLGAPDPPSPGETWSFVEEYEAARGAPFTGEERGAVAAAAIYALAYVARWEHALDPEGRDLAGSFREALPTHAGAYFRDARSSFRGRVAGESQGA